MKKSNSANFLYSASPQQRRALSEADFKLSKVLHSGLRHRFFLGGRAIARGFVDFSSHTTCKSTNGFQYTIRGLSDINIKTFGHHFEQFWVLSLHKFWTLKKVFITLAQTPRVVCWYERQIILNKKKLCLQFLLYDDNVSIIYKISNI